MSSQKPTRDTLGRTAPKRSHPEPKTLGVFLKVAAAVLGIACHFGPAYAQAQLSGATAPGVPTTPYARPDDSTSGVTQATPANQAMTCQTGYVVSGGQCVALVTLIPPTPECAYGQVRSGGTCVALPTQPTPPTNCPSGQVLSGGVCVPLPTNPTPTCATQPDTTQYIPCPYGQTGSIVQSRSGTCNASTSYTWSMTGWSTTSNTCSAPQPTSCPAQPSVSQTVACPTGQSGTIYQGRSATCNASTGYAWTLGSWYTTNNSCAATPPAPCYAIMKNDSWGVAASPSVACTFYGAVPQTSAGGAYTVTNQTPGYTGTRTYRCNSGPANWTNVTESCEATAPTTFSCPTAPAGTQTVACPTGQTGAITQSRSLSCNTAVGTWTLGAWYQTATTCATPPPASCAAGSVGLNWGAGCAYNGPVPQTAVGSTTTIYNQAAGFYESGFQTFRCTSGPAGWTLTGQDCQVKPPPPPPATVGCASRAITLDKYQTQGFNCSYPVPAASHSQIVTVNSNSWAFGGAGTFQCFNGVWTEVGSTCWFANDGG